MAKKVSHHYGLELNLVPKSKISESTKIIATALERYTQEALGEIHECLFGVKPTKVRKQDQCIELAQLIDFPSQAVFNEFFSQLPLYLRKLIKAGCFDRFIDIRSQDWGTKESFIIEDEGKKSFYYYSRDRFTRNPRYRLGLFDVYDQNVLHFNEFFGQHFSPFIFHEETFVLQSSPSVEGEVWSAENQIAEIFPLFVEALIPILKERDSTTIMRKGLLKGNLKDLRSLCGLAPFPLASSYNLDPLVLLAKFLLTFEISNLKRPDDAMLLIKTMVQRLFFETHPNSTLSYGSHFEYYALLDQCSLNSSYSYSVAVDVPARNGVFAILSSLQVGEAWYSVDDLFHLFILRGFSMRFYNQDILYSVLYVRGQTIQFSNAEYSTYDEKGFHPWGPLRRPLFERPLFSAYMYLLASLGIVDIAETSPALNLIKNEKEFPLTPYEALKCIRLTSFGAWCLNMVNERPIAKKQVFETITDKELLLVTFKGKSLERRLFLDQIGIPLGVERYRITEASFIKGCSSSTEILERIEKFKRLIDDAPSSRWMQFFSTIQMRSLLFSHGELALLYSFPDDPEIRKMFSTDPAFKKLVIRAEDNKVVVKKSHQKAFQKLLMEHGYLNTLS